MDDRESARHQRIVDLFEDGKRFTKEVLEENERLRGTIVALRHEIRELESHYVKVDIPRLQERVRLLEEENRMLREEYEEARAQYATIEKESWDFSERYLQVESQNSSLLNLYVASQRLHATLDFVDAVAVVKEIVVNLIGSEHFRIDLVDRGTSELIPVAWEGLEQAPQSSVAPSASAARVAETGTPYVRRVNSSEGTEGDPAACVPLRLLGEVAGVITILELLPQKSEIEDGDLELFELLGDHALTMLCASHLTSRRCQGAQAKWWPALAREISDHARSQEGLAS